MPIIVSDSAAEESLQAYTSPLSLQAKALDDLSEKVLNGAVVSDGNNVFTFLTEFASNMTADIVNKACDCFNSLYPENAQTATELYKHLSDFGYIGLYATPASTTVELVFNRSFLIDQAVEIKDRAFNQDAKLVSGSYSKIIIPAYSKFTIGEYTFGLMYPIEIRVRKSIVNGQIDYANSVITVLWDTSYQNPLMPLESHILQHRDFTQEGVLLTAIEVPIYQFEVENHVENAIASTGFAKRYDYKDKFYAIRIFHFKDGRWNELKQTFSDTNYDVDIPTAIVKVLMDIGKVEIVIPHIYFNSVDAASVIGNRILVKIYTTRGEVNVDLSEYQLDQFTASFLLTDTNLIEDDTYSNMLKRIPTVYVLPLSTRISSGTNGITFQDLKNRVKYNNSYTVKITPKDLENYFNTSGYTFTKELDNITDRVYCAHKVLSDKTGSPVASGTGIINVSTSMLTDESYANSISKLNESTFTIHPSALYLYDENNDIFTLVKDSDKDNLLSEELSKKVDIFNNSLYSYSPFHIVVSNINTTPIASTYDMYNPVIRSIMLDWENESTTTEISIYGTHIETIVENDRLQGYKLKVSLYKTNNIDSLKAVEETQENIRVLLTTETSDGMIAHMFGSYFGSDEDGKDVFLFDITSQFRINDSGDMDLTSFKHELGDSFEVFVPLKAHTYAISFFIEDEALEKVAGEAVSKSSSAIFSIPNELDKYTMLCRQVFTMKFGEALPLIQSNISIATTDAVYKTYSTMQFATYQAPVYERYTFDNIGSEPVSKIGTMIYPLQIKHNAGDVIISGANGKLHGPVLSITTDEQASLELEEPYTSTSDVNNVFKSLSGSLYVVSESKPEFTGIYDRVLERKWMCTKNEVDEMFDCSILTVIKSLTDESDESEHNYEFRSSNDQDVINLYNSATSPVRELNTHATGTDRKWFLIDGDDAFDFETYTGYVIEYNKSMMTSVGVIDGWSLNKYETAIDPETNVRYPLAEMIVADIDDPSNEWLDSNNYDNFEHDRHTYYPVTKAFIIESLPPDVNGVIPFAMYSSDLNNPEFEAEGFSGNEAVASYEMPWEVEWKAADGESKSPSVTLLNSNSKSYNLHIEDALEFMVNEAKPLGQVGVDQLYRYVKEIVDPETNEYETKITDKVEGKIFVIARGEDNHKPDPINQEIDYSYTDTNDVEYIVGGYNHNGGLYYRDHDASNFDYEAHGLSMAQIKDIFSRWNQDRDFQKLEDVKYDEILSYFNDTYSTKLTLDILKKIVSDSNPCFLFPWRKIVSCDSSNPAGMVAALESYISSTYTKDDDDELIKNSYAGYVSVLTIDDKKYINFLSDIIRTKTDDNGKEYKEKELSVNAAKSTWIEIDKWPWEYITPWIDLSDGSTVNNLSLSYNKLISNTKVVHDTNDVELDEDGNLQLAENGNRELVFGINTIQCDYKLRLSEDAEYTNYLDDIRELLRSYLYELKAITPSLLARTKLYFSPIRTFGYGKFKGSNGEARMLPVQCSMELGLHIESYVHNSITRKQIIRDEIINYILADIKDGTINLSVLAKTIMKELSDDVMYVDVLGINDDKTLQTLIPVDEDCYPQLKQVLVLHDDGTIHVDHALTLDWYVIN